MRSIRVTASVATAAFAASLVGTNVAAIERAAATPPAGAIAALNFSPTSHTIAPVRIQGTSGTVANPASVITGGDSRITGHNSYVVLDFGREVAGIGTLSFHATSDGAQSVGLAFSESSLSVGINSDSSTIGGADGYITGAAPANGTYLMPADKLRGGFRYLTVFLNSAGWVDLYKVSLTYTAAPTMADPSAYANYFYSNDNLLNQIWYAGAHTVQTDTIDPNQAWHEWPTAGWRNDLTIGVGTSVVVDGAKRDRKIWPGDMGIALPTAYASTNDMLSSRNSLQSIFNLQDPSGELPYMAYTAGEVFDHSDTYHLWTLVGTSLYYTYSGDRTFLDANWAKYKAAVQFSVNKIDGFGLMSVTNTNDWGRSASDAGENIEANAILYAVLTGGATLASAEGDSALASSYANRAATLKAAANSRLWDATATMYRDNPTSTLTPQDGNSLAVWFGLTDSAAKATAIAGVLSSRWNSIGAQTAERGGAIGNFPGSMEVHAHFVAGDDQHGLDLIRRQWGYMLNSPIGTASTFWEGMNSSGGFDYEYKPGFTSLAHGWATGPTSALTFDVLGTSPTGQGTWRFAPHPGDLTSVEGRITLPQGALNASWARDVQAASFTQSVTSPVGTTGVIGIPKLGGTSVTVAVNGAVVWSGGAFTARPGIGGASQDENYVYLSGVTAGSYTLSATGVGAPGELPAGYTQCATEAGSCAFSGSRVVAFGAGNYRYRTATGSTPCDVTTFGGDPIAGVLKSCYVAPIGGPATSTSCAAENGTCTVSAPTRLAYGANGAFAYRDVTSATACTNAAFGSDPIAGVAKSCYLPPPGGPAAGWVQCAAENATCASLAGQPVAYGARGAFAYTLSTGSIACSNALFGGDPLVNVVKACYIRSGPPNGFATTCAAENATCAFNGFRTVAFGAAGRVVYRSFTNGAACTAAAFGVDPLYGVAKSCYLTP